MGAHLWTMARIVRSPKPVRLTIEELRQHPGTDQLSDEQLDQLSITLMEYSMVLYNSFQISNEPVNEDHCVKDLEKIVSEVK